MDIQEIQIFFEKNYSNFLMPVQKISEDTAHNCSLCVSEQCCYNYDQILADTFAGKDTPASMDAIGIASDTVNFIEFKNGKIDLKQLRAKIVEGMFFFQQDILQGCFLKKHHIKTRFILVYNAQYCSKESENKHRINNYLLEKARLPRYSEKRFVKGRYDQDWHVFDEAIALPSEIFMKRIHEFITCV